MVKMTMKREHTSESGGVYFSFIHVFFSFI